MDFGVTMLQKERCLMEHIRLYVGLGADLLTFGGGLVLARDAFSRLKELNESKVDERFSKQFPNVNLVDPAAVRARMSERWAYRGLALLILGFGLQIASRFLES
jgi:hypothetical protein